MFDTIVSFHDILEIKYSILDFSTHNCLIKYDNIGYIDYVLNENATYKICKSSSKPDSINESHLFRTITTKLVLQNLSQEQLFDQMLKLKDIIENFYTYCTICSSATQRQEKPYKCV
jgi:hypothetical protein